MTVLTEGIHPVAFIMSEANWHRSRDAIAIAAEQAIEPGMLLVGKALAAGVTTAQSRTGSGNGVLTFANPAVSDEVRPGRYVITMTGAGATAPFIVEGPGGQNVGAGAVGTAFDKQVKFTVADGSADFAAGDQIFLDIGVEPIDTVYEAWDPTQGGDAITAIACYGVTTGVGETKKITGLTRDAEVNGHCLTTPDTTTAAQLAKAYDDLRKVGIIVRN